MGLSFRNIQLFFAFTLITGFETGAWAQFWTDQKPGLWQSIPMEKIGAQPTVIPPTPAAMEPQAITPEGAVSEVKAEPAKPEPVIPQIPYGPISKTKADCKPPIAKNRFLPVPIEDLGQSLQAAVCASDTRELRLHFADIVDRLERVGRYKVSGPMEGTWSSHSFACSPRAAQLKLCDLKDFSALNLAVNSNRQGIKMQVETFDRSGKIRIVSEAEPARLCRLPDKMQHPAFPKAESILILESNSHRYAIHFQDDQCAWIADLNENSTWVWKPVFRINRTFSNFLTPTAPRSGTAAGQPRPAAGLR